MQAILNYLKKYGQRLDTEIAEATGIPLPTVQASIEQLAAQGEIMKCKVTRYEGEVAHTGIQCRMAGSIPPSSPGRKPGAKGAGE